MKWFIYIFFLCSFKTALAADNSGIENPSNVYLISIGINNYTTPFWQLNYCVNDALYLEESIKSYNIKEADSLTSQTKSLSKLKAAKKHNIKGIIPYVLTNEKATLENIRNAFKDVISKATYNDYFVFLFSGLSAESKEDNTYLIPYSTSYSIEYEHNRVGNKMSRFNENELFSIVEMAKLMEQIACKRQLIISEAGNGSAFSKNLISELFDSNPYIAKGTERNRIIISTKEIGRESTYLKTGYLMGYILRSSNVLDVFHDFNNYELRLNKAEVDYMVSGRKYVGIYQEQEYRDILLRNYQKIDTRGSKGKRVENTDKLEEDVSKTYAFVLATDTYNKEQTDWPDLKNPINDADAVADLLETKYRAKVKKVYNKSIDEVYESLTKFIEQISENDKLIFFVAGHGYYHKPFSDGFLVMTDSYSLESDKRLGSYLSMGTLNRMLDGVSCKQVFSIFDVCYGASFELNNADMPIENYINTKMDNGLDDFIKEKDKNIARIVLASGQYEVFDYWRDSEEHSPFADKLIKALQIEKEFISPGRIFSYVQGNATTPILKKFGKHEPRGDFLIKVLK